MRLIPTDPFQRVAYLLLWLVLLASCIRPPWMDYLLLQHAPTVVVILFLGWILNRVQVSRQSILAISAFLVMHILGARYLYSYTPYDELTSMLFGFRVTDVFGFERNHYDRLVHFMWGFLLAIPIQEVERRYLGISGLISGLLAIEAILATSAFYELLEWLIAVAFAADWAESFLGQQGDQFDAQKDMALALTGAVLSMSIFGRGKRWQSSESIVQNSKISDQKTAS